MELQRKIKLFFYALLNFQRKKKTGKKREEVERVMKESFDVVRWLFASRRVPLCRCLSNCLSV